MPIFEYKCEKCNTRIEEIVMMPSQARDGFNCSVCSKSMEEVTSAPSIRFKGPGFYVNDYGRKKVDAV